jgi:hypothetical protein
MRSGCPDSNVVVIVQVVAQSLSAIRRTAQAISGPEECLNEGCVSSTLSLTMISGRAVQTESRVQYLFVLP